MNYDFSIKNIGYLNDKNLKILYSAVDAVAVPSRLESFGQIACEANSCQTPVVAFNTGGLRDIIKHRITGYLAEKFNTDDFSNGIKWILFNDNIRTVKNEARNQIVTNFNSKLVAEKYLDIYYQNL